MTALELLVDTCNNEKDDRQTMKKLQYTWTFKWNLYLMICCNNEKDDRQVMEKLQYTWALKWNLYLMICCRSEKQFPATKTEQ